MLLVGELVTVRRCQVVVGNVGYQCLAPKNVAQPTLAQKMPN